LRAQNEQYKKERGLLRKAGTYAMRSMQIISDHGAAQTSAKSQIGEAETKLVANDS
jgi:hypothetical protein